MRLASAIAVNRSATTRRAAIRVRLERCHQTICTSGGACDPPHTLSARGVQREPEQETLSPLSGGRCMQRFTWFDGPDIVRQTTLGAAILVGSTLAACSSSSDLSPRG